MLETLEVMLEEGAIAPTRAHSTDAGLDLYSPCFAYIPANGRSTIDTGVHVFIPKGYYGHIESKSGLMKKSGITARGTIDAGYTGTIQVVIFNHSNEGKSFERGEKITQLVIIPCETPSLKFVNTIPDTDRKDDGFGSSGK